MDRWMDTLPQVRSRSSQELIKTASPRRRQKGHGGIVVWFEHISPMIGGFQTLTHHTTLKENNKSLAVHGSKGSLDEVVIRPIRVMRPD
jgi:hypothetical protein